MSDDNSSMKATLRGRLEELRARREEIEHRHAELQRMLGDAANDYVRTGGALEELEYQLELVEKKQNPPVEAEGGRS
jgi:hypothetical protein